MKKNHFLILSFLLAFLVLNSCNNTSNVLDTTPPAPVTELKAVSQDGKITLTWQDPEDLDLYGVKIYSAIKNERTANLSDGILVGKGVQEYDVTNLEDGEAYTFKITAVDTSWNESSEATSESVTFTKKVVKEEIEYVELKKYICPVCKKEHDSAKAATECCGIQPKYFTSFKAGTYTIFHMLQDNKDLEFYAYTEQDDNKTLAAEATIDAVKKEYTGFTAKQMAFSETYVFVYYDRNVVSYTFNSGSQGKFYDDSTSLVLTGAYETKVNLPTRVRSSTHYFKKWIAEDGLELPETFGLSQRTFNADWETLPVGFVMLNDGTVTVPCGEENGPFYNASTLNPVTVEKFLMADSEVTWENWKDVYNWATTNGYSFANQGKPGSGIPKLQITDPATGKVWNYPYDFEILDLTNSELCLKNNISGIGDCYYELETGRYKTEDGTYFELGEFVYSYYLKEDGKAYYPDNNLDKKFRLKSFYDCVYKYGENNPFTATLNKTTVYSTQDFYTNNQSKLLEIDLTNKKVTINGTEYTVYINETPDYSISGLKYIRLSNSNGYFYIQDCDILSYEMINGFSVISRSTPTQAVYLYKEALDYKDTYTSQGKYTTVDGSNNPKTYSLIDDDNYIIFEDGINVKVVVESSGVVSLRDFSKTNYRVDDDGSNKKIVDDSKGAFYNTPSNPNLFISENDLNLYYYINTTAPQRRKIQFSDYDFSYYLSHTDEEKVQPVTSINWRDAVVWCNAASEKAGLTPVYYKKGTLNFEDPNQVIRTSEHLNREYGYNESTDKWGKGLADTAIVNPNANGYRLPTEAEWEFAARGGDPETSEWNYRFAGSNGIDNYGWCIENSSFRTHGVKTKLPNSIGIYDMCGNVNECLWGYKSGSIAGVDMYTKGGCWESEDYESKISTRINYTFEKGNLIQYQGLRVARSIVE